MQFWDKLLIKGCVIWGTDTFLREKCPGSEHYHWSAFISEISHLVMSPSHWLCLSSLTAYSRNPRLGPVVWNLLPTELQNLSEHLRPWFSLNFPPLSGTPLLDQKALLKGSALQEWAQLNRSNFWLNFVKTNTAPRDLFGIPTTPLGHWKFLPLCFGSRLSEAKFPSSLNAIWCRTVIFRASSSQVWERGKDSDKAFGFYKSKRNNLTIQWQLQNWN